MFPYGFGVKRDRARQTPGFWKLHSLLVMPECAHRHLMLPPPVISGHKLIICLAFRRSQSKTTFSEPNSAMSSRRTPTKLDRFIAKRGSRLPYEPRGRPREWRDCASRLSPFGIKCHRRILNMFLKRWQIKKIWLTLFWNIFCFD